MIAKRLLSLLLVTLLLGCAGLATPPLQDTEALPAGKALQFFYDSQGGKVEAYLIRPQGEGPFPLMVLLHGHSLVRAGATRVVPVAEQFSSELCYASLSISLPGYGMTRIEGSDADREIVSRAVLDGIAMVGKLDWVDETRVMVYGFSRGAVFAAALAPRVPDLRGMILNSGAYDINRLYRETGSYWIRQAINPDGLSSLQLFTILPEVSEWRAPTLILHGSEDQMIPPNQATLLRERLQSLGKTNRLVIFSGAGHRLPRDEVKEAVVSFLTEQVGSACGRSPSSLTPTN